MKIKKEELLKIVKEQLDMGEMAAPAHPVSRTLYYQDKPVGHRLKAGGKEDVSQKGKRLPAYIVIYTCGDEVRNFIETHQDLIEHIKKTYIEDPERKFSDTYMQNPDIIFTNEKTCPAARPYQQQKHYFDAQGNEIDPNIPVIPYEKSGKHYSLKESINRILKSVLFGTKDTKSGQILDPGLMNDPELNEHLTDCSIPSFKVRQRSYEDRHDVKNTNQRIHYGSDAFVLYESANDFLGDVLNRTVGLESEVERRETHLARLRNKIYSHWNKTKKNEKKYEGLTDRYYLEKRGYTEKNYDVNIYAKFDLLGTLDVGSFTWRLQLDIFYGKKITVEDMLASRNVKLFKSIAEVKISDLGEDVSFPNLSPEDEVEPYDNVMGNPIVLNGLKEAINEFKQKIMEISTDDALEMANYFQYEIGEEVPEEMAESFNKIIKTVIKESGMKKTIRIKESDFIRLIAENVVKGLTEQEKFDDFITKAKQNNDDMAKDAENDIENDQETPEEGGEKIFLKIGKDEEGNFYIIKDADTDNAKIIAKTK